jgi:hypothetical protein
VVRQQLRIGSQLLVAVSNEMIAAKGSIPQDGHTRMFASNHCARRVCHRSLRAGLGDEEATISHSRLLKQGKGFIRARIRQTAPWAGGSALCFLLAPGVLQSIVEAAHSGDLRGRGPFLRQRYHLLCEVGVRAQRKLRATLVVRASPADLGRRRGEVPALEVCLEIQKRYRRLCAKLGA